MTRCCLRGGGVAILAAMSRFARVSLLAFTLGLAAAGNAAAAQPGAPTDPVAQARQLGEAGVKLYQASRWDEAYDALSKAEELHHAPTLVLFMARTQRARGRLLEARTLYQKLDGEPLDANAPEAFRDAQRDARTELAALAERIPQLTLRAKGGVAAAFRIDDWDVPSDAPYVELDPGNYTLVARAPGKLDKSQPLSVAEGARQTVELELLDAPSDGPATHGALFGPGIALLAAGGAGLLMGAVTGGVSLARVAAIKEECIDNHCPASSEPAAEDARALGIASTVTLTIGGVAVVSGLVMLLLDKPPAPTAGRALDWQVGPGGISLGGRF
jgi:hypothetical protein